MTEEKELTDVNEDEMEFDDPANAIQENDTEEASLKRYIDKCREDGLYSKTLSWSPRLANFKGHSDAEVEAMIPDMLANNEIHYGDVWDF